MNYLVAVFCMQLVPCAARNVAEFSNPIYSLAVISGDSSAISDTVTDMEKIFARSIEDHVDSMARISAGLLTLPQAVEALQNTSLGNSSEFKKIMGLIANAQATKTALRAHSAFEKPAGYSGLAAAKKVLNDMIYESMSNYDQEIAKCTDYYSKQCALLEVCRGSIAASNFVAANSRALILDAQGNINKVEKSIPATKLELKQLNLKCKHEMHKMNSLLKIIMGDIAIMTMILKMTDCDVKGKKVLLMEKLSVLRCRDECTKGTYISFNHKNLQEQMKGLHSKDVKNLMTNAFADLFNDDEPEEEIELVQVEGSDFQKPKAKKPKAKAKYNITKFNNPPLPVTKVPGNPCTDPNRGAPSAADKRAAKCTIKKSPQCYKLQSRFLSIQGGIQDERDALMDQISQLQQTCKDTKKTLELTIQNDEDLLASSQTKLAEATQKEASAAEAARQTSKQNDQLNSDLMKQMKLCSANYIQFETEICALKKIRGELYKMKGGGHPGFFTDCEVSKWSPEACTKKCAGGQQKLTRSVLTHPNGGAKCLPLAARMSCNNGPCPVDCVLKAWTGWSKCSADCGGGVTQRLRDIKVPMKFGGKPCSTVSESKSCNIAACEKDCDLSSWTKWSACSKDCDGGTKKRQKFVQHAAEGSGKCPGEWSLKRLQYKQCNMKRCKSNLACNKTMDVIMMLDGCPRSGAAGWGSMQFAATKFIDRFDPASRPNVAVIQYCGPRTWSGVSKCTGKSNKKVDMEKTCKIKSAQHFTTDMAKVKSKINGLQRVQGEKLLELALLTAKAEMALGRKKEPTIVVVFIDGTPLSYRKAHLASQVVRKAARLLYVPVIASTPLKEFKKWSTRRWQENIVKAKSSLDLWSPDVVTHLIADVCPDKSQRLKFGRKKR